MVQPPQTLERYFTPDRPRFDAVIDVRSPSEFADDHIPGAVNLPVLSDEERGRVGTVYKQVSPFQARLMGAALVSRNIARHLEGHFADKPKEYRPLVYCWRGGQRSGSFALVLGQVGFRTAVLAGGYKTYRSEVVDGLRESAPQIRFRVLAGRTGSGKTRVLRELAVAGGQVLDLEDLACHRGSLLGSEPGCPQPPQRLFESRLYGQLRRLDLTRPVWVEAESSKVGDIHLPAELWQAMKAAGGIELDVPATERAAYLLREYRHFVEHPDRLKELIGRLQHRLGGRVVDRWCDDIDAGRWEAFVTDVLERHYDPAYRHSRERDFPHVRESHAVESLSDDGIRRLAERLRAM